MQQNRGFDSAHFREIFRQKGLKITPQRTAVYESIIGLNTHPSADEVYKRVRDKFPNISFDTVNRTLLTFSECGIIDIIESSSGVRRFDPQTAQHHHLHCTECGKLFDFTNPDFDNLSIPKELRNRFDVKRTRVFLTGICGECGNKKRKQPAH